MAAGREDGLGGRPEGIFADPAPPGGLNEGALAGLGESGWVGASRPSAAPIVAVAALVVLGRPVTVPRRLRRAPVDSFAWVDRFEGTPIAGP